eukprot:1735554-Alexandrium_andersonii.AAC.1
MGRSTAQCPACSRVFWTSPRLRHHVCTLTEYQPQVRRAAIPDSAGAPSVAQLCCPEVVLACALLAKAVRGMCRRAGPVDGHPSALATV